MCSGLLRYWGIVGAMEPTVMNYESSAKQMIDVQEPGVPHAIARLESRISSLDRSLAMHGDRLAPVLRPVSPSAGVDLATARETRSPVAEGLFRLVDQLDSMIGFVDALTDRIDA